MKYLVPIAFCTLLIFSAGYSQVDTTQPSGKDVTFPTDSSRLKTVEISFSGGSSIPYLPEGFHDNWKKGWNAGVGVGLTFAPGQIGYGSILLNVNVNRFAFDYIKYRNSLNQTNISTSRNPSWIVDAMFHFRGTFTPIKYIQPYFIVGIGYLHYSQGDITVTGQTPLSIAGESKSTIAWDAGAGINIPVVGGFSIFGDIRSVIGVATNTRQYFPLSGGIRYHFAY